MGELVPYLTQCHLEFPELLQLLNKHVVKMEVKDV